MENKNTFYFSVCIEITFRKYLFNSACVLKIKMLSTVWKNTLSCVLSILALLTPKG